MREAVEELTVTFEEFQAKMTREVLEHTNSAPTNPDLFCGDDIENMEDVEDTMSVIKSCVDGLQIENKESLNLLMQNLYNEALTVETI